MSRVKIVTPKRKNPLGVATSKGAFHLVGLTVIVVPVKPLATATTAACATPGTLLYTGMKRLFLPAVSCFLMKTPPCS